MMPVGPLMKEHRLIEKMIKLMDGEAKRIAKENRADVGFIETAVDFIKTYADKYHHGKEEDILFKELSKKKISAEHENMIKELIEEHKMSRTAVGKLVSAKDRYANGDASALDEIKSTMEWLVGFYPAHIEKEDKHFFLPVMNYLTDSEKEKMLDDMSEFDKNFTHVRYSKVVGGLGQKPV